MLCCYFRSSDMATSTIPFTQIPQAVDDKYKHTEHARDAELTQSLKVSMFFLAAMEAAILQLDTALRKPDIGKYLEGMVLP